MLLLSLLVQAGCATAPADKHTALRDELDTAIEQAADYLESQQADDGSWPSQTYGLFRDGVALTPHVLRALRADDRDNDAVRRGFAFVSRQAEPYIQGSGYTLKPTVLGPVYFCADTMIAINNISIENDHLRITIRQVLKRHQIGSYADGRVWAQKGGWGYSNTPFDDSKTRPDTIHHFDHGQSTTPIVQGLSANISATVYALDALAPPLDKPYRDTRGEYGRFLHPALQFTMRCQNAETGDPAFDDGGFFFNPADAARNKGGPAGTDKNGYARFHSSGSSTADGLRVLLLCRVPQDHPRFVAARDWLFEHFDPEHNPGTFNDDREVLRDAYYFYYAASAADTFTLLGEGPEHWARDLAKAILSKQRADGSFTNPFTDGKENDPLVATPFALRVMLACSDHLSD